jgi:putative membrane protein
MTFKKALVIIFILFWIALAINPVDYRIWALENILVVTMFPLILWLDRRYNFNKLTFLSMTIFVILHLFGAHMTYNAMPYFNWVSELFGWQRNNYDQVIHFLFGLMLFVPFFEIFYHQGTSRKLSYLMAFLFISSVGGWYEVLEWLASEVFCPFEQRICFDGLTQNDIWDAQKDILYAVIGSVIALLLHKYMGTKKGSV